ncbi:MAG: T9SS type A sorting domain-containing protein [Bacteroidales bacterium]|nr:T9SS type A sorting domain-containing protein [Bacteroidales bacterium]
METLYGLKRKKTNRWLKFLLLLFVAVGFGIPNLNAQTKAIKVANDQQLLQAMDNPSVQSYVVEGGYYDALKRYVNPGTTFFKKADGNGNRDTDCQYFIEPNDYCYDTIPGNWVYGIAVAGTNDPNLCSCCPPDSTGTWQVLSQPSGSTLEFIGPLSAYTIQFRVDMPGIYVLLYTWPFPYNTTGVFGSYPFYGPYDIVLTAPDVCEADGLETLVHFEYTTAFSNQGATLTWTLDGASYTGPPIGNYPPADTTYITDFPLVVGYCGLHTLSVTLDPVICPPITETIYIDFSCEPIANAGPDAYVCYDNCYSLAGSTGLYTFSSNYAFTWRRLSGPGTLTFDDDNDLTTNVCRPAPVDTCRYGVYEIALDVVNGECDDKDTMLLTFYEQPEANAGPDQQLCAELCFSLAAVPYDYCGLDGVNYFKHAWWELVSQPDGTCTVNFDALDESANVCITDCDVCAYGTYVFVWNELNVKIDGDTLWSESHCFATDTVSITIFEQPVADAGDDYWDCVDAYTTPYTFLMTGSMEYCYSMQGVWAKSCGPGDVVFDDLYTPGALVSINEPGRYIFTWTAWNAECEDVDTVIFDLLEQPTAYGEFLSLDALCDDTCIDLGLANIDKYDYFGVDGVINPNDDCPNYWDMAHWFYVDGPLAGYSDPTTVTFADDTDPATDMCVSYFGAYTVGWVELNQATPPIVPDEYCSDTVLVFIEFFETPAPDAGDDSTICGNCYTLVGIVDNYEPAPNQHGADHYYWTALAGNPCDVDWADSLLATTQVCIPDDPYYLCYGEYGFVLHQSNGLCLGTDTVYITFNKIPDPIPICFENAPNDCGPLNQDRAFEYDGCLEPNEVLEVCADGWTYFYADSSCLCGITFNPFDTAAFAGWTLEWSVIAPAGTIVDSEPGYYDFLNDEWNFPWLIINWGECCDTARIYLTITTPEGCENTMEYKAYVYHMPCIDIIGDDVSEVGLLTDYCNNCPADMNSCLLYTWTAEHCGEIVSGQGTDCIEVLWTDYNVNGGWGEITLTVFDTCTGCCNYDEMLVKIYPTGTLGNDTLSGHVFYHNTWNTPLNGVEIQLWNSGIPVQSDTSFNDIEGGNGVGYYEFPGVSGTTPFGITASYDAPWYGANATDALAVELKVINSLPGSFLFDVWVREAMDVNNSNTINSTDALWIKQRAINMVNYFPHGDWVFDTAMISTAAHYEIYTLNAGDANRSNIPASMKETPAIALVTDGTMNVITGQEFELPIRIADANQFGAITLNLGYNSSMIEVVDVASVEGMLHNISNGNVSIAWSSVNPMVLAANDVVVTLKVKAISPFTTAESLFSIGLGSEFADASASVIEPVTLKTFGITTEPAAEDYFLSANRPNPFSNSTFIEYTMPETGKVKLNVLDMLGQEIAVLVNATQTAGSYTVEFSAAGLATGVYIYKITVDGETRDFISTQRMVISH